MKKILLSSILAISFVSCNNLNHLSDTTCQISIDVVACEESESRVCIDENWNVTWIKGESLMAWSAINSSTSEFTMSDYSANLSTFEGTIYGDNFRLVSPYISTANIVDNKFIADLSEQDAGLGSTYMISKDLITLVASSSTTPEMKHIGMAITLNINFENYQDYNYTLTKVEIGEVPVAVAVNLEEEVGSAEFYGEQTLGSMVVNLSDEVAAQGIQSLKFNALPFIIEPSDVITINLYLEDKSSLTTTIASVEIENSSAEQVIFDRATYNTINCSFDLSTLGAAPYTGTLNDISASSIPTSDTWVITDTTAETTYFAGLSAAIQYLSSNSDRKISLSFPNLKAIPGTAIFGTDSSSDQTNLIALTSVSAPVATTIGNSAFAYCKRLVSANFPSAQSIESYVFRDCTTLEEVDLSSVVTIEGAAFYNCSALNTLTLATADGVIILSINKHSFYGTTQASNIDLTLGAANSENVDGTTLTVDRVSHTFKSITLK